MMTNLMRERCGESPALADRILVNHDLLVRHYVSAAACITPHNAYAITLELR